MVCLFIPTPHGRPQGSTLLYYEAASDRRSLANNVIMWNGFAHGAAMGKPIPHNEKGDSCGYLCTRVRIGDIFNGKDSMYYDAIGNVYYGE